MIEQIDCIDICAVGEIIDKLIELQTHVHGESGGKKFFDFASVHEAVDLGICYVEEAEQLFDGAVFLDVDHAYFL